MPLGITAIDQITPHGNEVVVISGGGGGGAAVPSLAADVHAPASATAAVVTYAANATKKHYLYGITWSYDVAPTGGNLKIEDIAGTIVFTADISAAGPGQLEFSPPIVGSAVNTAMIVTLASGGAGVTGKLSCRHEVK